MTGRQLNQVFPGSEGRIRPGYGWLFCMILCYLVLSGFEDSHLLIWGAGICLWIAIFVLALHISDVGRKFFLALVGMALILAGASVSARFYHSGLENIAKVAWSGLMLLVPVAILRKVRKEFQTGGVGLEVVLGALCAYLLIGAYFAYLYNVLATLSKRPFFAQPGADGKLNYLYFSFVTLTTTGYGDITPAFGPGQMIAVTEAVLGQLYLVSVVAIVVSAFRKRTS
jgi:Ion channel